MEHIDECGEGTLVDKIVCSTRDGARGKNMLQQAVCYRVGYETG